MNWRTLRESLLGRTARCQDGELPDELDEVEVVEQERNAPGAALPPYRGLLQGVKAVTMNLGGSEINGFKLSFGLPLSPNFMMSHEIAMAPPKPKQQGGFNMAELMGGKQAFYTLNVQYHHGNFAGPVARHICSLVGKVDSTGRLDAIFFAPFQRLNARVHFSFLNSNMQFSNFSVEGEYKDRFSKHTLTYTSQAYEYTLMSKLGSRLAFGVEATYMRPLSKLGVGFALRYMRNARERYYVNWSETNQATVLGSLLKVDNATTIATELEMAGENYASLASLGYRRKGKNYEVNSAVKSNGEMKTLFTFNNMNMYKLKFFLAGNFARDDFRSGYSVSIGQTDD